MEKVIQNNYFKFFKKNLLNLIICKMLKNLLWERYFYWVLKRGTPGISISSRKTGKSFIYLQNYKFFNYFKLANFWKMSTIIKLIISLTMNIHFYRHESILKREKHRFEEHIWPPIGAQKIVDISYCKSNQSKTNEKQNENMRRYAMKASIDIPEGVAHNAKTPARRPNVVARARSFSEP